MPRSFPATVAVLRSVQFRAALAAMLAGQAWGQLVVGPNVNISKTTGEESEPAIAINPANPLNLFALSNDLTIGHMRGAVSTDGGQTWVTREVGTGSDGLTSSDGDPCVCFDNFGNLFLSHLTSALAAQIGLSTNGGTTFSTIYTSPNSTDQPTVTAGAGAVWITFNLSSGQRQAGAAVTGLGTVGAFGALSAVAPGSATGISGSFGDICIGPGGKVAICYQNASSGQGPDSIYFNLDVDGLGAGTMGPQSIITSTNVGGFDSIPAQNSRTIDAESGLAWDRTGGLLNNRLYLVYTDETVNENNDTDIRFRYSDTNGATWSPFVRLNDDTPGKSQFFPRIAVDQKTGHIAVCWLDCRNSPGNNTVQCYATDSMDGGVTWAPNKQVAVGLSTALTGNPNQFGDYMGLTIWNDVFYPIWPDNSNSTGDNPGGAGGAKDMYTAKVTICYANCDFSTTPPTLNVNDFACFLNKYAAGDPYANCDGSTIPPVINVNDFACFLNRYSAGCP